MTGKDQSDNSQTCLIESADAWFKKKDCRYLHKYTVWYRSKPKLLRRLRCNRLCPGRHKLRYENSGAEYRLWLPQATKTAWRFDGRERLKRRDRHEGPDWWQPNAKLLGREPHSEALVEWHAGPCKSVACLDDILFANEGEWIYTK